jgi:glycerophosphoryl diester phosphodiesterase
MADYDAVIQAGVSVIELHVRALADGRLVVYQDDAIRNVPVEQWTAANLERVGISLLELEGCLKKLHGRTRLCVWLKTKGIETAVFAALQRSQWSFDDYALSSSSCEVIRAAREMCSDVRLGLHVESCTDFRNAFRDSLLTGADYLAPNESLVQPEEDLARAREARVLLVPWIVNDENRLRLFLANDAVAGVITSEVDLALGIKAEL